MRRGIITAIALLNLAVMSWAPVAAAQPYHVILLADQGQFTDGTAVTFTVLTFQGDTPIVADALSLEMDRRPVLLTATDLGIYVGTAIPSNPSASGGEYIVFAEATARFAGTNVSSTQWSYAVRREGPRATLEVSEPSAMPGERVTVVARFSVDGTPQAANGVVARMIRMDPGEPERRIDLSRVETGVYRGTFDIGASETWAHYRLEVSGRIAGQNAMASTFLQRLGPQIWLHLITATSSRVDFELWGIDVYGRPLAGTEFSIRLGNQSATGRAAQDGHIAFTFGNPGAGTLFLAGRFSIGRDAQTFDGRVVTGEEPGRGFAVSRAGGAFPPLLQSGENATQILRVYDGGSPAELPLVVYDRNRTTFGRARVLESVGGQVNVTHDVLPGDGWLDIATEGARAVSLGFTGTDPEIRLNSSGLRVGGSSAVQVVLEGRLRREFIADPSRAARVWVVSRARTGAQPTWQPLGSDVDTPGTLARDVDRLTGLFEADLVLPRFLPEGADYVLTASARANLSGSFVPFERNFVIVTATARHGSTGWGSPEVFAGLLVIATVGITFAFLPLRRKRPEIWDGPRTATPPTSPPNAGTGPGP